MTLADFFVILLVALVILAPLGNAGATAARLMPVAAVSAALVVCFVHTPSAEDMYRMLGYNVAVPPHVRQALFSRSFDNDDLLPLIKRTRVIKPSVSANPFASQAVHALGDESARGQSIAEGAQ